MSKRSKQLLKLACNNVISTNATNSKPSCCRNLTTLFHKTSKHEEYDGQNTEYVRQWVNESQPSYGKQIGDITLDNTNYVNEISNDDYNILDNANYVNEISYDDLNILDKVNYVNEISNDDLNILENINDEAVLPIEQNNDDAFEESLKSNKNLTDPLVSEEEGE